MRETVVHVRYDYNEAVEARKEILQLEVSLLNTLKAIKKYNEIRKEELKLKVKLLQKSVQVLTDIKKIKENLPSSHLPESIRKRKEEMIGEIEGKESYNKDIEIELERIKEKLQKLQK